MASQDLIASGSRPSDDALTERQIAEANARDAYNLSEEGRRERQVEEFDAWAASDEFQEELSQRWVERNPEYIAYLHSEQYVRDMTEYHRDCALRAARAHHPQADHPRLRAPRTRPRAPRLLLPTLVVVRFVVGRLRPTIRL